LAIGLLSGPSDAAMPFRTRLVALIERIGVLEDYATTLTRFLEESGQVHARQIVTDLQQARTAAGEASDIGDLDRLSRDLDAIDGRLAALRRMSSRGSHFS
jgi:hypothetical protein